MECCKFALNIEQVRLKFHHLLVLPGKVDDPPESSSSEKKGSPAYEGTQQAWKNACYMRCYSLVSSPFAVWMPTKGVGTCPLEPAPPIQ